MTPPQRYDAFISYAHATDGRLGSALERDLQRFGRRWNRAWAARVFRDEGDLAVTPALWRSIAAALRESNYLILLASPGAASSQWVSREVEAFLQLRGAESLLILLTDGEIRWDDASGDFDWSITTALPPVIGGALPEEPKYLDLRGFADQSPLGRSNPRWMDVVAELSGVLLGRSKDELVGEDARNRRQQRLIMAAAVAAVTIAPLGAVVVTTLLSREAQTDAQATVSRVQARTSRLMEALMQIGRAHV